MASCEPSNPPDGPTPAQHAGFGSWLPHDDAAADTRAKQARAKAQRSKKKKRQQKAKQRKRK